MPAYDVVVVGLGIMGSAALRALAGRGLRVVGIERFAPGHDRGSSHGATRIIRLGYFEHPSYVPLLRRAYTLWRELERDCGRRLMHITGIVEIGPPDGIVVTGTLAASREHELAHEVLGAREAMRRFPAFKLPADDVAVTQPDGGYLLAEPAIDALIALAQTASAEIRTGETVRAIEPRGGGVRVTTQRGYRRGQRDRHGRSLENAAARFPAPLRVTRQVLGWFEPLQRSAFANFPVFLIESRHGIHYGFPPDADGLVKVAKHHHGDRRSIPKPMTAPSPLPTRI